ncbi:MAG: cyanate lyase [Solirubrobacteraceae bacterium]|nr:cyanate lyase [Solirubrobacteraceae bacterium]MEA2245236.1 cyanate lyase [Solirubrobacteraceae bacterium]
MNRQNVTALVLDAKREQGLSFADLAEGVGADRVWLTAALLGQHPLSAEQAAKVAELLRLPGDATAALQEIPLRGSLDAVPPADPTIYRLQEIVQVYGTTLKALIHEDFGDGIMSAINFNMGIDRVEHPDGDRIRITMEGKYLPYQW